ncbi:MAG: hypothetical protein P9L97_05630 [Candidatus Tenebribacter davisii]|nr:hypothetical protein [Candidatus Tenebribacter davisii]
MKTKELLSVLNKVKPGIAAKNIIESMTYFYFSGTNIITYNDKISIQHQLQTDFALFVKAQDLYNLVSKITTKDIDLVEKDGKLNISCKTMKAKLSTINDSEIKIRIDEISTLIEKAKWKPLSENFSESVKVCVYTASKQDSDGTLTCIYVNGKNCISSDNARISHSILKSDMDEMFIKASEVQSLINTNPTEYAISNSWLHFKNEEGCIFSIRKVSGEYPDFLQFFEFEGEKVELSKGVLEGIDLTSVLVDDSDPAIKFKISNNSTLLSIKSDGGTVTHRSKIKYDGKDIEFTINPEFLKEMMRHSSTIILGKDKAKLKTENFSLLTTLYG